LSNVCDAGVRALAEAGCGCGLRTLILGAVLQGPFSFVWLVLDCSLTQGGVSFWFFCIGFYVVVIALSRYALGAMNWVIVGIV